MVTIRVFQNVSQVDLEICELGKPIKARVVVKPGETSPPVKVSKEWTDYITTKTGFALLLEEREEQDDTPEGYVEITEVGDSRRKFRPMTPEERNQAGLAPIAKPVQPAPTQPSVAVRPTPAAAIPAPIVPVTGTSTATGAGESVVKK